VTNPKALILLGSTPPQFVNRATADEALQMHLRGPGQDRR
jgi:hypothetical protein